LDNQGYTNAVHCRGLLHSPIHCEAYDLGGIAEGPRITTNLSGQCMGMDIGSIYFVPDATANVPSLSIVS